MADESKRKGLTDALKTSEGPLWWKGMLQRSVSFSPAYHNCPHQGIGSVQMVWTLRDGLYAVQWILSTGWYQLPDDFRAADPECDHPMHQSGPRRNWERTIGPIVYHQPTGEQPTDANRCEVTGVPCKRDLWYYGGDEVYRRLTNDGEEAAWGFLEQQLARLIGGETG
jgi:hypothetical protein